MKISTKSISSIFFFTVIMVSFISIIIIGYFWISNEYERFNRDSEQFREHYINLQKNISKMEVERAVNYVHFMRQRTEERLRENIRGRVTEAHQMAKNIYNENVNKRSLDEIKKMVKDALRNNRFNQGRGYYFATNLNGTEELFPPSPNIEGKSMLNVQDPDGNYVIRDMINIVKKQGEGFYKYLWSKPGSEGKSFPKIAFVKYFKPFNWFLSTGEYLDEFEAGVKQEVLELLTTIRYDQEGYVFVNTYSGDAIITDGKLVTERKNLWDLTDPDGVKVIQEERKAVEKPEGDFIYYKWRKLTNSQITSKISFIKGVPEWEWMIGAGVYLDEVESIISQRKAMRNEQIMSQFTKIIIIFVVIFILILIVTFFFSRQIKKEFDLFISSFRELTLHNRKIEEKNLIINEFKQIALFANEMSDKSKTLEETFKTLTENIKSAIYTFNENGEFLYFNPAMIEITGYSAEEISKMKFWELAHPDYKDAIRQRGFARIKSEPAPSSYEFKIVTKDNKEKWIDITPGKIDLEKKAIVLGIAQDITEKKNAAQELLKEKEQLAVTLRSIAEGVITIDKNGFIILMNKVAEKLTGYRHEDAVSQPLEKVFHLANENDGNHSVKPFNEFISNGDPGILNVSATLFSKSHQRYDVEINASPIRDDDSNYIGLVIIFRDITVKRQMEDEIQKNQKLESLGLLAGGIAHDFNNLLTGITGNISLAKIVIRTPEKMKRVLEEAYQAAMRAQGLTEQLLTFARGGAPIKKTVSLEKLLKESVQFALRGSNVKCEFKIPDTIYLVEADENQMSQVFNNLTINADQAMPDGGKLIVKAKNVTVKRNLNIPLKEGKYIKIEFIDEGIGIPRDYLKKVFDPYFTTKQKGNGLGLATAYSIINKHEGYIVAESESGQGTTFVIYLKASSDKLIESEAEKLKIIHGTGKILVMDDEQMILDLLMNTLSMFGYEVTCVQDGDQAIHSYKDMLTQGKPFDLVIMDLTIPGGKGGKETIEELYKIDNNVNAVVSSGYSNDPIVADYKNYKFNGFLLKPYRVEELSKIVGQLIKKDQEN